MNLFHGKKMNLLHAIVVNHEMVHCTYYISLLDKHINIAHHAGKPDQKIMNNLDFTGVVEHI
jgi:hypothetical protein